MSPDAPHRSRAPAATADSYCETGRGLLRELDIRPPIDATELCASWHANCGSGSYTGAGCILT
jgi:hypothetical protein